MISEKMSDIASALLIIHSVLFDDDIPNFKGKKLQKRHRIRNKELYSKRSRFPRTDFNTDEVKYLPSDIQEIMRMDESTYNELLIKVQPLIKKKDTIMRDAITPFQRLSATLSFLSSGQSFEDLKFSTAIAPQTLGKIILETCEAIITVLKQEISLPKSEEEWKEISNDFYRLWKLPNCLGIIDGRHIEIKKPPGSGSYYFNYKKTFSVILTVVVNANNEFTMVEVGVNGSDLDEDILSGTSFCKTLNKDSINIPIPNNVSDYGIQLPFVFFTTDGFPLMNNIMRPFSDRQLNAEEDAFNQKLSIASSIVEDTMQILTSRFRILVTTINLSPQKCSTIILACCYLHNYLRRRIGQQYVDYVDSLIVENIEKDRQKLAKIQTIDSKNTLIFAEEVRNKFCKYFSN